MMRNDLQPHVDEKWHSTKHTWERYDVRKERGYGECKCGGQKAVVGLVAFCEHRWSVSVDGVEKGGGEEGTTESKAETDQRVVMGKTEE